AFFAAVEELEDPTLRTKPLVVGGDPRGRGVVATANYEARKFGIHSAMSCAEASRRCPHAIFVRPRHSLYRDYSRSVWEPVRGIVPTVRSEELEDPTLRTKPLVGGGDPRGRGVVATANYEARKFGIHSAMSCAEASRRCPHAIFVRPRHSLYRDYSRSVWETVRGIGPTV